jgi:hypothetical protein
VAKYKPNPHTARLARFQKRRQSLEPVAVALHTALEKAVELLSSADDDTRLRAIHAVTQCANTYARMYEVGELEYRVAMLEAPAPSPNYEDLTPAELERLIPSALHGPNT